jgi:hypothetical protein
VDAPHLALRPQLEDGAERWAGRARGVRAQDVMCRQLGPRAAPEAERDAAELYTPAAAQSAERSCAESEVAQLSDAPAPLAARSPKPAEALRLKPEQVAASPGVPELRSRMRPQPVPLAEPPQPDVREQPEAHSRMLPEAPLPASLPEALLPEHA